MSLRNGVLPWRRKAQLTNYLNPQDVSTSFAVIGGEREMRNYIALYALARACGQKGVIVLHSDRAFEASLPQVMDFNAAIRRDYPDFYAWFVNRGDGLPENTFFYSPLFGLGEAAALNALLPREQGAYGQPANRVRSVLRCYWRILLATSQDACLDTLLDLTEMPFPVLEAHVLPLVSEPQRSQYHAQLSALNAQQDALAAVLSFAYGLGDRIWTRRSVHTGLSLVTAVRNRQLISLYLQPNQQEVLDYLEVEMQALAMQGEPFLLISYGSSLQGSALYQRFFTEHTGYATGVIAASLSGVLDDGPQNADALIAAHPDTVVLSCLDQGTAEAFSLACGHVLQRDILHATGRQRQAFSMRSTQIENWAEQVREDRCIRPEFLMNLGSGALLTNPAKGGPLLTYNLALP